MRVFVNSYGEASQLLLSDRLLTRRRQRQTSSLCSDLYVQHKIQTLPTIYTHHAAQRRYTGITNLCNYGTSCQN